MEKKVRKKRTPGAAKIQSSANDMTNRTLPPTARTNPTGSILDIPLNPNTARQAIILSEIIGKPVSKRGRRR